MPFVFLSHLLSRHATRRRFDSECSIVIPKTNYGNTQIGYFFPAQITIFTFIFCLHSVVVSHCASQIALSLRAGSIKRVIFTRKKQEKQLVISPLVSIGGLIKKFLNPKSR